MTYTKKMHDAARRETAGKQNIVTDLLDEIDRLQGEVNSAVYLLTSHPPMHAEDTSSLAIWFTNVNRWLWYHEHPDVTEHL